MASDDLVARFIALFPGSHLSYGSYNPKKDSTFTKKDPPLGPSDYISHLKGKTGVGVVPICANNVCSFGVIDVDTPDEHSKANKATYKVTPEEVAVLIAKHNLPLIPCRSKSGGTHCYAFFSKPVPCSYARSLLKDYAVRLGFPAAEIFPKQDKLVDDMLGTYINLPYFDADDTKRYAIIGGKQATFEYFIEAAESLKADLHQDLKRPTGDEAFDFAQAPPCVRKIYDDHAGDSMRNNSLYQAAIWLKRQYPDDWKDRMDLYNNTAFGKPVEQGEFKKIRNSVARKDYQYKCKDEPCLSLCEKDLCKTLKFGVRYGSDYVNMPPIESVIKIATDPPSWIVNIYDQDISMNTRTLLNAFEFKIRVMDLTSKVIAIPRADDWDIFIKDMMDNKLTTHGKEQGVALNDAFASALAQVVRDAQTDKQEADEARRRLYVRDTGPAVINDPDGKPAVLFRLLHLEQRLRAQFQMRMTPQEVSTALHMAQAEPKAIRIANKRYNVWAMPFEAVQEDQHTTFKPEY